jgi:hypothetical protein
MVTMTPGHHPIRTIKESNGPTSATTHNWCGYVLENAGTKYYEVGGAWSVPVATPHYVDGSVYLDFSVLWVGLDGYGNGANDVVQAGSESETQTVGTVTASQYYLWTENFPALPVPLLTGVSPGDRVFTYVWVGNANGTIDGSNTMAFYYLYDQTRGTSSFTSAPPAAAFYARTAEFVAELPSIPNLSYGLADFGTARIDGAMAWDVNGNPHTLATDSSYQLFMSSQSTNDLLCWPQEFSSTSVGMNWVTFQ